MTAKQGVSAYLMMSQMTGKQQPIKGYRQGECACASGSTMGSFRYASDRSSLDGPILIKEALAPAWNNTRKYIITGRPEI